MNGFAGEIHTNEAIQDLLFPLSLLNHGNVLGLVKDLVKDKVVAIIQMRLILHLTAVLV
jgi:hypothetical protein